jgi:hypothetical protein
LGPLRFGSGLGLGLGLGLVLGVGLVLSPGRREKQKSGRRLRAVAMT